ncbi:MAG TPA: hypothetical protein VMF32_27050 [Xanthobacteraceae bacterium]|nr:hypothetical protein [Xanthobacteraceae bacterium]
MPRETAVGPRIRDGGWKLEPETIEVAKLEVVDGKLVSFLVATGGKSTSPAVEVKQIWSLPVTIPARPDAIVGEEIFRHAHFEMEKYVEIYGIANRPATALTVDFANRARPVSATSSAPTGRALPLWRTTSKGRTLLQAAIKGPIDNQRPASE